MRHLRRPRERTQAGSPRIAAHAHHLSTRRRPQMLSSQAEVVARSTDVTRRKPSATAGPKLPTASVARCSHGQPSLFTYNHSTAYVNAVLAAVFPEVVASGGSMVAGAGGRPPSARPLPRLPTDAARSGRLAARLSVIRSR